MLERDEAPTAFRSDEARGEAGGSGSDPFGTAAQYWPLRPNTTGMVRATTTKSVKRLQLST